MHKVLESILAPHTIGVVPRAFHPSNLEIHEQKDHIEIENELESKKHCQKLNRKPKYQNRSQGRRENPKGPSCRHKARRKSE